MNKLFLFLVVFSSVFCFGCASIYRDNRIRISGIVQACKSSPQNRQNYLKLKVENKQISEIVSYTIQECLKDVE